MSRAPKGEECDAWRRLVAASNSPHPPEPPQRSAWVEAMLALAHHLGRAPLVSPHCFDQPNESKVRWEYDNAETFPHLMAPHIDLEVLRGRDVLDVGCGWGGKTLYLTERFGPRTMSGFDLPEAYDPRVSDAFAGTIGVHNCDFRTGYAERIPYPAEAFDVLICEDVLEHVREPEAVIRECARVLRPGGRLIAKFPSFRMMYAHHPDRAINLPALHYLLPMKTWAAGLNAALVASRGELSFEPFSEVHATAYAGAVTADLNGMDFDAFAQIIRRSPFETVALQCVALPLGKTGKPIRKSAYRLAWRIPALRELLSSFVLFVGSKPEARNRSPQ